jgi:heme/copper-type cytochrome/quinol oxidase subunit 4
METEHGTTEHENIKGGHQGQMKNHYVRFLLMIISMFITMYVLMYVLVSSHSGANQFQMTVLMTAPMVAIEIILMNELYRNKRLNRTIVILSLVFTIACWVLIREQTTIFEMLFSTAETTSHSGASMEGHDSAATNTNIEKLCGETVRTQAEEIRKLKEALK